MKEILFWFVHFRLLCVFTWGNFHQLFLEVYFGFNQFSFVFFSFIFILFLFSSFFLQTKKKKEIPFLFLVNNSTLSASVSHVCHQCVSPNCQSLCAKCPLRWPPCPPSLPFATFPELRIKMKHFKGNKMVTFLLLHSSSSLITCPNHLWWWTCSRSTLLFSLSSSENF